MIFHSYIPLIGWSGIGDFGIHSYIPIEEGMIDFPHRSIPILTQLQTRTPGEVCQLRMRCRWGTGAITWLSAWPKRNRRSWFVKKKKYIYIYIHIIYIYIYTYMCVLWPTRTSFWCTSLILQTPPSSSPNTAGYEPKPGTTVGSSSDSCCTPVSCPAGSSGLGVPSALALPSRKVDALG